MQVRRFENSAIWTWTLQSTTKSWTMEYSTNFWQSLCGETEGHRIANYLKMQMKSTIRYMWLRNFANWENQTSCNLESDIGYWSQPKWLSMTIGAIKATDISLRSLVVSDASIVQWHSARDSCLGSWLKNTLKSFLSALHISKFLHADAAWLHYDSVGIAAGIYYRTAVLWEYKILPWQHNSFMQYGVSQSHDWLHAKWWLRDKKTGKTNFKVNKNKNPTLRFPVEYKAQILIQASSACIISSVNMRTVQSLS